MNSKWFYVSVAGAACLTLCSGVIQGMMHNRWGVSAQTLAAADKLQQIPEKIEDWQMLSVEKLDDVAAKMLDCAGYCGRQYMNQKTQDVVSVMVLLGPPGTIAVHTPEICIGSKWYAQLDKRKQMRIGDSKESVDEFWAVDFQAKDVRENLLKVYYAWSTGGRWSSPDNARFAFAGQPYLYKIQVSSSMASGTNVNKQDACLKFLRDFVPAASKYLIEPSMD
jgi:hypothetical protein